MKKLTEKEKRIPIVYLSEKGHFVALVRYPESPFVSTFSTKNEAIEYAKKFYPNPEVY